MPDSQVYQEIGRRDVDTYWMTVEGQEALSHKCVVCGAPKTLKCCNPVSGLPRAIACIGRIVRSTPKKAD